MSKEKQIEEMAKDLCQNTLCNLEEWNKCKLKVGEYCARCKCLAERLVNAGYRKQSEWISVEERLPVPYADVIVYDKASGVIMDSMLSTGEFVNGIVVTHWMPLPEAPKGGAE